MSQESSKDCENDFSEIDWLKNSSMSKDTESSSPDVSPQKTSSRRKKCHTVSKREDIEKLKEENLYLRGQLAVA